MIRRQTEKALICVRVADVSAAVPGSTPRRCGQCGAAVWVSPASTRAAGPEAKLLCIPCFAAERGTRFKFQDLTPEQAEEVRREFQRGEDGGSGAKDPD